MAQHGVDRMRDETRKKIAALENRIAEINDLIEELTPKTLADHLNNRKFDSAVAIEFMKLKAEKTSKERELWALRGVEAALKPPVTKPGSSKKVLRSEKVYLAIEKLKNSKRGNGKTNDDLFEMLAEQWGEDDAQAIRKAYYDHQRKKLKGKQTGGPAKGDSKGKNDQGNQGAKKSPK